MTPSQGHILAFSGHRIDAPDRPRPRFPPEDEAAVAAAIAAYLDELDARAGYAAAASGADILFLEALKKRGAEAVIVLPLPIEDFRAASVGPVGSPWSERFEQILDGARVSVVSTPWGAEDGRTYAYGNLIFDGRARRRAARCGLGFAALAVWDGQSAAIGGAGWMVQHWRRRGLEPRVIRLGEAPERALPHEELDLSEELRAGPDAPALLAALAPWPSGL